MTQRRNQMVESIVDKITKMRYKPQGCDYKAGPVSPEISALPSLKKLSFSQVFTKTNIARVLHNLLQH